MLVKNIIKTSSEYLDLKDVVKYLNGEIELTDEISSDIDFLMLSVNMVNNNIASSYIELVSESKVFANREIIEYSEISNKSIIEIKNVCTLGGQKLNFKTTPGGIKIEFYGDVVIEYSYFPEQLLIDSEINYYLKMNEITFAIGVVSEYLYIKGVIDDAYMWDKRFKNTIFNLLRPKRNIVLPVKRW